MMPSRSISLSSSRPFGGQRAFVVGAVPVDAGPVVDRAERDQASARDFSRCRQLRIESAPFEAEQVADGQFGGFLVRGVLPASGMRLHFGPGAELHHFAALFHGAIPGELPLRLRPGLLRAAPAGKIVEARRVARDLRGDA